MLPSRECHVSRVISLHNITIPIIIISADVYIITLFYPVTSHFVPSVFVSADELSHYHNYPRGQRLGLGHWRHIVTSAVSDQDDHDLRLRSEIMISN